MVLLSFSSVVGWFLVGFTVCAASSNSVVILHRDSVDPNQLATYHATLERLGFDVLLSSPSSSSWPDTLNQINQNQPSNLVLFGLESNRLVGGLSPASLYAKLETNTNLIIAIDNESLGPNYHKLAQQVNIIQPLDQSNLIDHSATHNNSVQLIANNQLGPIIQTDQLNPNLPILFNGVGHLSNRSPMVYPVGHCSSSCYSPEGSATGSAITLVSAVQLKNNNRLIWSGSLDLFKDHFTHQTNNELFTTQISSWAFQQSGVLRLDSVRHSRRADHQSLSLYKVNDQIDYSVRLSTLLNGSFVPMLVSDGQVELTMLDPHLRLSLSPNQSDNSLEASFTAPDRHGVFTLNFDYRRAGYSFVQDQTLISLAPPRHDQFDRFIKGAAPFYAGAATVSLATISFIALWASL